MALAEEPRWYWVGYCAGLGAILAIAALIGGEPGLAVFCFVLLTAFGLAMRRYNDTARLLPRSTDERQKRISSEGALFAGYVQLAVVLGGLVWEIGHGYTGPFVRLAALSGAAYFLGEFLARRRL